MSRGNTVILISIIGFAGIHFGMSPDTVSMRALASTFIGGCAFLLMTWAIFLSTRARWIESAFGGLDRMYQTHKYIGVAVMVLMLLHFISIPKLDAAEREPIGGLANITGWNASLLGMLSLILLVLAIVMSLNRKIPHHIWLKPHRLMGLLFLLTAAHMLHSPAQLYSGKSASGFTLAALALVGLAAFVYRQVNRQSQGEAYTVSNTKRLERVTELTLSPVNADTVSFKSGQFGFLSLDKEGFREQHPFTISSAPAESSLRFTVKALGDFTRRIRDDDLIGANATVEGPYGRFTFANSSGVQLWVAGGIGITPFLSELRSMNPNDQRTVALVYCVRNKSEALFIDELDAKLAEPPNRHWVLLESSRQEYITLDVMESALSTATSQQEATLANAKIYICGPKPMKDAVFKAARSRGVPARHIHHEVFEFR